jgi:aminoglycoside phosphotransferase (APT) family kinase protein
MGERPLATPNRSVSQPIALLTHMATTIAPDDIVATHAEADNNSRPPLLVLEPLRAFLDEHGLGAGEIQARPIGEGHSNVTYLIERDGAEVVLRRPPRPPLPPSAHDVLREARLLRALADTPARVPRVLAVCEDESAIGCPFYVMELVAGEVIVSDVPAALDTPARRREIAQELIEALAEIHSVDWRAAGLEGFGKPTGYLERQVKRFGGLWEINRTREIPAVERVGEWLAQNMPASGPASIVHGDYRLGNTIFAAAPPVRLQAVLDWEMATIGDPLADLGYLCMMWTEGGDPRGGMRDYLGGVTRGEGFPTRGELIEMYEARTGRSMEDLRWYTTLALWKAVVFMEGNYKRAVAGATDDPYLKQFGEGVVQLAQQAEGVALGND